MGETIKASVGDSVNRERFFEAQVAAGIHLSSFAELLGISRISLWRKLNGRTAWRPLEIERAAEVLKVTVEWLVDGA